MERLNHGLPAATVLSLTFFDIPLGDDTAMGIHTGNESMAALGRVVPSNLQDLCCTARSWDLKSDYWRAISHGAVVPCMGALYTRCRRMDVFYR